MRVNKFKYANYLVLFANNKNDLERQTDKWNKTLSKYDFKVNLIKRYDKSGTAVT